MWIQIFKSGTHTDSKGNEHNFTEKDLDLITEKYNRKVMESDSFEAPLVKGHPKTDAPAFGWVEKIKRQGNILYAKMKNLAPEIIDEVRNGRFKKVSIALYPDLMLRHVGLLGASSPAVKGLKTVSFSEQKEFWEFNSNENNPSFDVLLIDKLKAQIKELSEQNDSLQKQLRSIEFSEFAEKLINSKSNPFLPNQKSQIVEILETSYRLENGDREFSEKPDLIGKIKNFLLGLNLSSDIFKEYSSNGSSHASNSNFEFENANPEKLELHHKILQMQKNNPKLSYEEAFYQLNNF